jgi:hypothetical protein
MWLRYVPALALIAVPALAHAETIEQAQHSPTLSVEIVDVRSYEAVRITIENHGTHAVVVRDVPGVVLENDVATEQDVTLTQPLALEVDPGKRASVVVSTYCIRPHDSPPHAGTRFRASGNDPTLSRYLRAHYALRPNRVVQNEVWRLTDHVPPGAPSATRAIGGD